MEKLNFSFTAGYLGCIIGNMKYNQVTLQVPFIQEGNNEPHALIAKIYADKEKKNKIHEHLMLLQPAKTGKLDNVDGFSAGYFKVTISFSKEVLEKYNRHYHYTILNGKAAVFEGRFSLSPKKNKAAEFKILIASCMKRNSPLPDSTEGSNYYQPAWDAVLRRYDNDIDAVLLLGDQFYSNSWERKDKWKAFYRQMQVSGFRRLLSKTPAYAIYDDHDFALNDECGVKGSPDEPKPDARRVDASEVYHSFFVIPPHDENASKKEGVFFKKDIGHVTFFFLDTRFYRLQMPVKDIDDGKVVYKCKSQDHYSLLGSKKGNVGNQQWEWLEEAIKKTDSNQVIVICMAIAYDEGREKLMCYKKEMEKLIRKFSVFKKVFLFTGNIHETMIKEHRNFLNLNKDVVEVISSGIGKRPKAGDKKNETEAFVIASFSNTNVCFERWQYQRGKKKLKSLEKKSFSLMRSLSSM